jgi:hypothetical protein
MEGVGQIWQYRRGAYHPILQMAASIQCGRKTYLFSNTKRGENFSEQIIRSKIASNFIKRILCQT